MSMLEGIRVVEFGTTVTAPLSAMLLADLGADVIKVERPDGDPFRSFRGGKYSPHFIAYNRGKRSVVIDLTKAEGVADAAELLATADVLIDNYRPGVLKRLGLDPEELRKRNPTLIHCSITGFGNGGPYRDRPAFDGVAQAISGMSSLFLDPEKPEVTGPTLSDNVTGMYAAIGVLGALIERFRTGKGKRIEINMLDASVAFIPDMFVNQTQLGTKIDAYTRVAQSQSYAFVCSDGPMLGFHLSSLDKFWDGMVEALDAPELKSDPRFPTRMERVHHFHELKAELAKRFKTRTRAEWIERLNNVDIPWAPVNTITEVMQDPQVLAMGTFFKMTHPTEGSAMMPNSPLLVDGQRLTGEGVTAPPPSLGAHTEEVLAGLKTRT